MGAIFFAQWFCLCGQWYHQKVSKTITWLPLTRLQGNKPHRNSPEPSEPCLRYLHQRTPELSGTLQNLPELASATYTSTHHNSPEPSGTPEPSTPELSKSFRNLPTPAHTATLRNLPELASGTYNSTHRKSPEPSGTCLRNLHQHTPELSGTFRNLPPEPAPATRTGTHRSFSGLKTPLAYAVGEKKNTNTPRGT